MTEVLLPSFRETVLCVTAACNLPESDVKNALLFEITAVLQKINAGMQVPLMRVAEIGEIPVRTFGARSEPLRGQSNSIANAGVIGQERS